MKIKVLSLLVALGLIFGAFAVAQAATSSIDNLPGGAGIFFWTTNPGGTHTLLNVQNVGGPNQIVGGTADIVVHIVFYDFRSIKLRDYSCPLSPWDNYSVAIVGDGSVVRVIPGSTNSAFPNNVVNGVTNCTDTIIFNTTGQGSANQQYGYGTIAIDRVNAPIAAGDSTKASSTVNVYRQDIGDGGTFSVGGVTYTQTSEPKYEVRISDNTSIKDATGIGSRDVRSARSWGDQTVVLPDMIFIRTAIVENGEMYGLNGQMLQGFMNMSYLQANGTALDASTANGVGWVNVVGKDANCTNAVNWGAAGGNGSAVRLSDPGGVTIGAPELYITDNVVRGGIAIRGSSAATGLNAEGAANCINNYTTRYAALGAAAEPSILVNGLPADMPRYWARFNNSATANTTSALVTIAPAATPTNFVPAATIADPLSALVMFACDDNEYCPSLASITPPEVGISPILRTGLSLTPLPGQTGIDVNQFTAGELIVQTTTPMFGFVATTYGDARLDIYSLVRTRINVNIYNLLGTAVATADDNGWAGTNVLLDVRHIGW